LKLSGVSQTNETISAASRLKFTVLWGHVEEMLNNFFPIVDTCQLRRYSPTKLCDGAQTAIFGDFLRPTFPASRVQYISDVDVDVDVVK